MNTNMPPLPRPRAHVRRPIERSNNAPKNQTARTAAQASRQYRTALRDSCKERN
jgi:hypothetical protein